MPVDTTGVATAAHAASLALELLAKITHSNAGLAEAESLRQIAEDDVAAYNRFLTSPPQERVLVQRDAIETPMRAARTALAGLDLCLAASNSIRDSVAADLGVAAELLAAAARGILLCAGQNLKAVSEDPSYAATLAERQTLGARAEAGAGTVIRTVTESISR